jgi:MFS family permease
MEYNVMSLRLGSLWRQADFMKLWVGQTISAFGSHITWQALPLTALLLLSANTTQLGLLMAIETVPVILLGLVAGVWVDWLRRRPLMILADLGRAILLGSIPLAATFGVLNMAQLFLVAGLAGTLTVFFDIADQSYLPSLVEPTHLLEANSKLSASRSLAELSGQPTGGVLVQLFTAPLAIGVDALSFLVSALCLGLIRKKESQVVVQVEGQSVRQEAIEGLRMVFSQPILRALVLGDFQRIFFASFMGTLYLPFILRELQMPVWATGVLVGVGGVSSLVGSLLAERVSRRFGIGQIMIGSALVTGLINLLIPLATGPKWLAFSILVVGQLGDIGWSLLYINQTSLRQSLATDHQLGRINASSHFVVGGAMLAGVVVGGALGDVIGLRLTLLIGMMGLLLAVGWLFFSPVRHVGHLMSAPAEPSAPLVELPG